MASPHHLPLKRASVKTRFARTFLRALHNLNAGAAAQERRRRCRKIKLAAYASMASAVGPRRAWSRALLWRIRSRASLRRIPAAQRSNHHRRKTPPPRPRRPRRSRNDVVRGGRLDSDKAKELRKLVPGGKAMDLCCLLDETAHYIKCLSSQVEIMRNIADLFST
ncbi:PREDICTED: transcription factor IBH1-like [Ipomoea nil]|uniref:transcription factor IBH1-like n=1 Tax=Ipomoea nil TaxID=35883 RepID=UPI0009016A3C|nr:PREDICTED: transcription factor IBH1-like [Ipomoea nil]